MVDLNLEKKQIDLISESLCVYTTCNDCFGLYRRGKLEFSRVKEFVDDKGGSCLYRLKQMCHDLFRNADEAAYKEKFYDMTVGYIFHEAMKLRENLYQLEYYKPQYAHFEALTGPEKKILHEFDVLIVKAEKRLREGLRQVRSLMKELVAQLKELIKLYKNNYLLPRFLLENEKSFVKIYGATGFNDLLREMYEKGRATLLFRAALSYLESEYYELARNLFQRAINLDSTDQKAEFFFLYASAFNSYFRNRPSRAIAYANRALEVTIAGNETEKYREALERFTSDLPRELRQRRRV